LTGPYDARRHVLLRNAHDAIAPSLANGMHQRHDELLAQGGAAHPHCRLVERVLEPTAIEIVDCPETLGEQSRGKGTQGGLAIGSQALRRVLGDQGLELGQAETGHVADPAAAVHDPLEKPQLDHIGIRVEAPPGLGAAGDDRPVAPLPRAEQVLRDAGPPDDHANRVSRLDIGGWGVHGGNVRTVSRCCQEILPETG